MQIIKIKLKHKKIIDYKIKKHEVLIKLVVQS